jgi:ferredoxin-NADP reductase
MEEFEQLARKHTGLQIRKFVSPTHIEKEDVKNATESDKDMFFIAGKPGFVKSFEGILRELGVSGSRIKADKFKAMRGRGYE